MPAGRESRDLFTLNGWRSMLRSLRRSMRWAFENVGHDTFGRFGCWFLGHIVYHANPEEPGAEKMFACRRCCKWIKP